MKSIKSVLAPIGGAVVVCGMLFSTAQAATVLSFQEVGGDVIGTLSGSLDLTGAARAPDLLGSNLAFIQPFYVRVSTQPFTSADRLRGYEVSGPSSYGSGTTGVVPTSTTASMLYLLGDQNRIALPDAYQSGASLSGQMIFASQSFLTLGMDTGTYVYSLSNADTFTIQIGEVPAVPLPAAAWFLLSALGGLGLVGWRRKRVSAG